MVKKCLIIEGDNTPNNNNGDLREGFSKLLTKLGCRVNIKMGAGKDSSIDKFKTILNGKSQLGCEKPFLLVDLDKKESDLQKDLDAYELTQYSESVCYMIQEMESWFLSQHEVLEKFYGSGVSANITKKHPKLFEDPVKALIQATKDSAKREYHKIRHGAILLDKLDPNKLIRDFPELKTLIEKLKE